MIDADDLALLAKSFGAAMEQNLDAGAVDVALHDLGWCDVLATAPRQGAATVFELLGATGSAATVLDDVLQSALGLPVTVDTCVVIPGPARHTSAGEMLGELVTVDGIVSARIDVARRVIVPVETSNACVLVEIDPSAMRGQRAHVLESAAAFQRVKCQPELLGTTPIDPSAWRTSVDLARLALAHQLIGASRRMLELAWVHAVDRVQFGRSIATFQAVRHKLAESLVEIEAAAAVAAAAVEQCTGLTAALAKSLAGKAARTTAANSQQVLAGIGFTTDHPFHHYLKRTMVIDTLFGSASTLTTEIGRALLNERVAPRLVEL